MTNHQGPTILVPTFNRCDLLGEALSSLVEQSLPPVEIIVIDDGSTDATAEVVSHFGTAVQYARKENAGKAAALNFGLRLARGSLIWIFDDDDIAEHDALASLTEALNDQPDAGFAFGRYANFGVNVSGERWSYDVSVPNVPERDLFISLLERCYIFQGAMLVRRSCYDEVGPFDESLIRSQDYDMLLRLTRRFQGARLDRRVFLQRQHSAIRGTAGSPISHSQVEAVWAKNDERIMRKVLPDVEGVAYISSNRDLVGQYVWEYSSLNRFSILARKNMWEGALHEGKKYAALKSADRPDLSRGEVAILAKTFDGYSRGFLGAVEDRHLVRFLRCIPEQIRPSVAQGLAAPLPALMRIAIREKAWDRLGMVARLHSVLLGPVSTLRVITVMFRAIIAGKLRGDAALRYSQTEASLSS